MPSVMAASGSRLIEGELLVLRSVSQFDSFSARGPHQLRDLASVSTAVEEFCSWFLSFLRPVIVANPNSLPLASFASKSRSDNEQLKRVSSGRLVGIIDERLHFHQLRQRLQIQRVTCLSDKNLSGKLVSTMQTTSPRMPRALATRAMTTSSTGAGETRFLVTTTRESREPNAS